MIIISKLLYVTSTRSDEVKGLLPAQNGKLAYSTTKQGKLQNLLKLIDAYFEDYGEICSKHSHHFVPARWVMMNTHNFKKVTHCIFDMDGTLFDTESMYHKAIRQVCLKYGKTYTKEMEKKMYGHLVVYMCETVIQQLRLPISKDEFQAQLNVILTKTLPNAPLKKGVTQLLSHLKAHGVPMALATNSNDKIVRLLATSRPKHFNLFHHKVCSSDPHVLRAKPYPDMYLVAASRFTNKPKPKYCLVFEDSAAGIESASAAGMQVVAIPEVPLNLDITKKATVVLQSLTDFKPEWFGLPAFDSNSSCSSHGDDDA